MACDRPPGLAFLLQRVLDLSWSSSTRLLIHFGDAPCHGNRYHNGRPVNGPDAYPAGNPDGKLGLAKLMAWRRGLKVAQQQKGWWVYGPPSVGPIVPCCAGLVPEDLLKQLVANRVDYHFARLCHHTDIMTEIFRGVYDAVPAGSAVFHMQVGLGVPRRSLLWREWRVGRPVEAGGQLP
jgi:hypothetical protein